MEKKGKNNMKVYDVAQYILNSIGGEISAMKLQKLCYYSQAWTLAWDDKELFPEEFLRWDNGPVCRELKVLFWFNKWLKNSSGVRLIIRPSYSLTILYSTWKRSEIEDYIAKQKKEQ